MNYKSNYNKGSNTKFCFGPTEIYNICKLLNKHAPDHANQMRTAESITKFVKNRTGNAAHKDEIELESLVEMLDHLIEHVIEETNMYDFPEMESKQTVLTSITKTLTLIQRCMKSTWQLLVIIQKPPS